MREINDRTSFCCGVYFLLRLSKVFLFSRKIPSFFTAHFDGGERDENSVETKLYLYNSFIDNLNGNGCTEHPGFTCRMTLTREFICLRK